MTYTIRPHVRPFVLSVGDGTRHWFYSIDGMSVGAFQFVRKANTVCGLEIEQQRQDKEWLLYAWEQGWDVTCDECRAHDPVVEREAKPSQNIDRKPVTDNEADPLVDWPHIAPKAAARAVTDAERFAARRAVHRRANDVRSHHYDDLADAAIEAAARVRQENRYGSR